MRQEITKTQKSYLEEFNHLGWVCFRKIIFYFWDTYHTCSHELIFTCFLGKKIEVLENAAENYYAVLAENRKLHNEVQDLKGATA